METIGGSGSAQRRIERLLSRIGMPSHLKGYQYLKTALEICLNDMEALDGITKRLYPEVAKKHKTTKEKVEHAVRHAIESAWKRGDEREHKNLFGYCQTEGKRPTNAEFITRMADYLYMTQLHFYPDNEEQEDLEGAQKRKSGI